MGPSIAIRQIGLNEDISKDCADCRALSAHVDNNADCRRVDLYCEIEAVLRGAHHIDPLVDISKEKEAIALLRSTIKGIREKMKEVGCPFQGVDTRMKYPCRPLKSAAYFVDKGSKDDRLLGPKLRPFPIAIDQSAGEDVH